MRPTKAIIQLSAIRNNLLEVRKRIPITTEIMAVVKANAYGHGAVEVSKFIIKEKLATYFGVAIIEEAIQLRKKKITEPILVFTAPIVSQIKEFLKYNSEMTLCSLEIAKLANSIAAKFGKKLTVHIKVDTGMGRIGVSIKDAVNLVERVSMMKHINLKGIYTHFASADNSDLTFARMQLKEFKKILTEIALRGINIPIHHSANSPAILRLPESHMNLVRPGIMLYGYMGNKKLERRISLKPALIISSTITFLKNVPKNTSISYNHRYITKSASLIGTLPIGYADGIPRGLTNKLEVIHNGKIYPSVGTICMDQIMVNFGNEKGISVGDEVILIGESKKKKLTAWDLSEAADSIPYEICTRFTYRIPRLYI